MYRLTVRRIGHLYRHRRYRWFLISVRGWVDPEGLNQWKVPIEPATLRLEAQCLNQLHHHIGSSIPGVNFLQLLSYCGSRNTSFSKVTALWDKRQAHEVRFPTHTEVSSRLQKPRRFWEVGGATVSSTLGPGNIFPAVKRPERESDHISIQCHG